MVPGTTLQVVPVNTEVLDNQNDVICIIQDETLLVHDWRASKFHINLPRSTTVHDLYIHTGKEFKYEENSFLLVWKRSATGLNDEEVELKDDLENMTLEDVGLPPEKKKQRFYLRQKEGSNPVSTNLGIQENAPSQNGAVFEDGSLRNLFDATTSTTSSTTSSPQYGPYNASSSTSNYGDIIAKSETGFVGLVNQAMTCYLNSLLQTLFMIPEFRNAIYKWKFPGNAEEGIKSISFQLQRLFVCLQFSSKRAVETTDVTRSFGWDSSHAWQQHDVQELCRLMFDELEKDFKDTEQDDLINSLYQGKMKDYVKCLECQYESARNDTFLDIPLVVRPFGNDTPHGSVEEALDEFVNPETLEGNNQYKCDKCDKFCDAHKGLKFCSFPHLLTLHLKRFAFDYNLLHRVKLNDRMTFRKQLNLNKYVASDDEEKDGVSQLSYSPCSIDTDSGVSLAASDNSAEDELPVSDASMEVTCNDKLDQPQPFDDEFDGDGMEELNGPKGPYIHELFSIMIHSGSAMGGHYYAYIKSFTDNQWYSFNDQTVTRITDSDIKRTFGGSDSSSRGYYSSHYSSSANAYMLMYRQVKKQECTFMLENDLPDHVKTLVVKLHEEERREQELKEWQRSVCKIKLFCSNSIKQMLMDTKLEIHKEKTLREATEMARKAFNLENTVSLENCRIVKYDEYNENLELSFEGKEETDIGTLLGGVQQTYLFDLLLEIKSDEEEFPVYKQGGVTVKVHQVNVQEKTVSPAFTVRVLWTDSLKTLQDTLRKKLGTTCRNISMVWERYTAEFSELTPSESRTLRDENFFKKNKIYVECTDDEPDLSINSPFMEVLENFSNSICLQITLPNDVYTTENNILEMVINRRITLSEFKEKLENRMGCSSEMFKVFRLYSNNQEMEMDRLNDTFSSLSDQSRIVIKHGRALKKDEFRAKVFLLRINEVEHTQLLIETIVSKGMTVLEWKKNLNQEITQTCQKNVPFETMRLRKKNWKSPGKILKNDQKYDDIVCTGTTEVFLEELQAPESVENDNQLAIYIRRWRPSSYSFDEMQEIVIDGAAKVPDLKEKLSEISKITATDIEIAKGRGSFPFEVSVLEINNELEWNPSETSRLRDYPIMVHDDGVLFYYRDKTEPLGELSEEKRDEIRKNENHGSASSSSRSTYKPKEKALKICTDR